MNANYSAIATKPGMEDAPKWLRRPTRISQQDSEFWAKLARQVGRSTTEL